MKFEAGDRDCVGRVIPDLEDCGTVVYVDRSRTHYKYDVYFIQFDNGRQAEFASAVLTHVEHAEFQQKIKDRMG